MFKDLREFENLHITLWLLKDTCWVMDVKVFGMIMIAPTLLVAFYIAWRSRNMVSDFIHNIAICLWIMANSVWMTGEFFYEDTLRHYALIFFVLGLSIVFVYYTRQFIQSRKSTSA